MTTQKVGNKIVLGLLSRGAVKQNHVVYHETHSAAVSSSITNANILTEIAVQKKVGHYIQYTELQRLQARADRPDTT